MKTAFLVVDFLKRAEIKAKLRMWPSVKEAEIKSFFFLGRTNLVTTTAVAFLGSLYNSNKQMEKRKSKCSLGNSCAHAIKQH